MELTKLLAGVLILVFVSSGFGTAKPQEDWQAFVQHQVNMAKLKNPHFVDNLTSLVIQKYGKELDSEIDEYATQGGSKKLTPEERETLKYLIVSDYVSYVYQKSFHLKNAKKLVVKPIKVTSIKKHGRVYNYYYTPMSSSIPYPIHWWVQVSVDINGGSGYDDAGNYYDVDGKNDMFNIVVHYISDSVEYELHFYDEDHPNPRMDDIYDSYRQHEYPDRDHTYGCEDIEKIRVEEGVIGFPSTFSGDYDCHGNYCEEPQTYAVDGPSHESGQRPYSPDVVIYVSNVWDHLMDTIDSNPSMSKVWWYYSWD